MCLLTVHTMIVGKSPSPSSVPRLCLHLLIRLLLGKGKWADVNSEVLANILYYSCNRHSDEYTLIAHRQGASSGLKHEPQYVTELRL